jgi:formamidopyrimidine-DNA glycosylase
MPELPEVETVRRDLTDRILGREIAKVKVIDPLVVIGDPKAFARGLKGRRIESIGRRGKALIFALDKPPLLITHFRMTGQLYPVQTGEAPDHTRVIFTLDDGRDLIYRDTRRLGRLELAPDEAHSEILANLGRDALEDPPSLEEFTALLARRKAPIKHFLMDQRHFAGIGNIYAAEILHRCNIHPEEPCASLKRPQVACLLGMTREVLTEAIGKRGTTISDYVTGTGKKGEFQYALRVYMREGESCGRDGCQGRVARIVQQGRSTYLCPVCQRKHPRRVLKG